MKDKTIVISGSGNVAIYAAEKAQQLGGKVVAMSDSNGYVYDPEGIRLDVVKDIKEVKRGRIKELRGQGRFRGLCGRQGHLDSEVRYRSALRYAERAESGRCTGAVR